LYNPLDQRDPVDSLNFRVDAGPREKSQQKLPMIKLVIPSTKLKKLIKRSLWWLSKR